MTRATLSVSLHFSFNFPEGSYDFGEVRVALERRVDALNLSRRLRVAHGIVLERAAAVRGVDDDVGEPHAARVHELVAVAVVEVRYLLLADGYLAEELVLKVLDGEVFARLLFNLLLGQAA